MLDFVFYPGSRPMLCSSTWRSVVSVHHPNWRLNRSHVGQGDLGKCWNLGFQDLSASLFHSLGHSTVFRLGFQSILVAIPPRKHFYVSKTQGFLNLMVWNETECFRGMVVILGITSDSMRRMSSIPFCDRPRKSWKMSQAPQCFGRTEVIWFFRSSLSYSIWKMTIMNR